MRSIEIRLQKIREYLRRLESLRQVDKETFLKDINSQAIAERNLQLAIQCCLDIGSHIIAIQGLERPEEYKDIFPILARAKILPEEFAKKIEGLAGFRNILVHDYLEIDLNLVYENIQGLDDLEKFARYIVEYLEK